MSALNVMDHHSLRQKSERQEKIIATLKSAHALSPHCYKSDFQQSSKLQVTNTMSTLYAKLLMLPKEDTTTTTVRNKRGETKSTKRRRELFPIIEHIYHESNQTYGAGRITVVIRERGIPVADGMIARIMH